MILERHGRIGAVLPYEPLPTSVEFIRSEYAKAEEEKMSRVLRSSLYSSMSTIVSFGIDSSMSSVVGSSYSSSLLLPTEVESDSGFFSGCFRNLWVDSQDCAWDQWIDKLSFDLDQIFQLYVQAVNTQKICIKTWQQQESLGEEIVYAFSSLQPAGVISTVVWKNYLHERNCERDRIWDIFCEATQAIVDIRAQIIKVIKIGEVFLDNHKQ